MFHPFRATGSRGLAIGFVAALAASALSGSAFGGAPGPVFPLKASANNRYLVDQGNVPFLMVGDAPQAMVGNLSKKQAKFFIANRATYGVNALWVNLLCDSYTACNSDGTTFDGIAPFTTPGDLSTPNPDYFDRAAAMIDIAASYGEVVMLDPIETGGWLGVLDDNGKAKAFAYGKFLGTRFKDYPNIIWQHGNDFQSWQDPAQDELVRAVAKGILSTDPNHIHTVELSYYVSASLDDASWKKILGLDAVYTYRPTYAKLLSEYARRKFKPTYMVEANYEFEQNGGTDGGSTPNLRHQEYWTMLSGATGQLYGSAYSWRLDGDWEHNLDTVGIQQFAYMKNLFAPLKWYDLVPDPEHKVLTRGYGQYSEEDSIDTDTYATAAATADGALAMVYMPNLRTLTINMAKLSGPVTARWFDPTNATFSAIDGSPFQNSGKHKFTPPGNNGEGSGDWVLLLQAD